MKRVAGCVVILGSLALAAGCGGDSGEEALSETAANLGDIRSGELTLSLLAEGGDARVGFELAGPFQLRDSGLPVAELAYTQIAGPREATVTLISTGNEAFVKANGHTYVLPEEQTAGLRQLSRDPGGGSGSDEESAGTLGALALDDWLVDPEVSDGEDVDGTETDRISAGLDVVRAANDVLALLAAFEGNEAPRIQGDDAESLRRATEAASVEILTGTDDRLLRSLVVDLRLSADAPAKLLDRLGPLSEAHFRFEVGVANPNEPVSVETPTDAEPFPAEGSS